MTDVYASALTPASVSTANASAVAGDTIVLPSGTATSWSSSVGIKAGVSLRGQGIASTILQQSSGINPFFYFNESRATTTYTTEISGFRCTGGGTAISTGYGVRINSLPEIYIHDIWIEEKSTVLLALDDIGGGVVCDSTFRYSILESSPGSGGYGVAVKGAYPRDWPATYPALGTESVVCIEDCTIYGCRHALQAQDCGRYVARYNTISGGWGTNGHIDVHGARDTEGENSSGLSVEIYNNDVTLDTCDRETESEHVVGCLLRGGFGVVHNNTFHSAPGTTSSSCIRLSDLDISTHDTPVYSYPDDYPIIWQPRNFYAWGNTYDGSAAEFHSTSVNWFQEDRPSTNSMGTYYDYRNLEKPGYTAYAYPHPLRGPSGGGGTYKMMHGVKIKLV